MALQGRSTAAPIQLPVDNPVENFSSVRWGDHLRSLLPCGKPETKKITQIAKIPYRLFQTCLFLDTQRRSSVRCGLYGREVACSTTRKTKHMPPLETETDYLNELLSGATQHVDIPPDQRRAAEAEYLSVANWLADHADGQHGWRVQPQGSFLLNTVVLPQGHDQYDLDTVCVREVAKESTTQADLKAEVGQSLVDYVSTRSDLRAIGENPTEGKRCWTLGYPTEKKFHMDILPAIPNPESSTGILITDRKLRRWQFSNPQAFADWFRRRCEYEFRQRMLKLAEAERVEPEEIPDWRIKTTLHQTVQILKLHRNHHYRDDLGLRPASILLTTLAARAYAGEASLFDALIQAGEALPKHIERPNGVWTVSNPVEPDENFADKWNSHPEIPDAFFEWTNVLIGDLQAAKAERGVNRVVSRLSGSFGGDAIEGAANRMGERFRSDRNRGHLGFLSATGALTTGAGSMPVKKHTFYGDSYST